MSWQQYATYDPITPVNQAFPSAATAPASSTGGTGGFGNFFSGPGGFLASTAVNSLLGGLSQGNTAQSAASAQDAALAMFDANAGRSIFDRNYDYFLQRKAPIDEARIKLNPEYRRGQVRDTLLNPGLAGRYSAFMA